LQASLNGSAITEANIATPDAVVGRQGYPQARINDDDKEDNKSDEDNRRRDAPGSFDADQDSSSASTEPVLRQRDDRSLNVASLESKWGISSFRKLVKLSGGSVEKDGSVRTPGTSVALCMSILSSDLHVPRATMGIMTELSLILSKSSKQFSYRQVDNAIRFEHNSKFQYRKQPLCF
jgi:hypothetical protein